MGLATATGSPTLTTPSTVEVRRMGHSVRVQIQNTITVSLTRDLLQVLRDVEADDNVHAIVIEGDAKIFCAGLDFKTVSGAENEQDFAGEAELYFDLLSAISVSSKFVISLILGQVNAGGVGIAAASDLIVAGPNASFALSELLFDLIPACVMPFLVRRTGYQHARQLALTTTAINVEEAFRWGLVDEWGPDPEQLLKRRLLRCARIAPASIGRLKGYMNALWTINDATRQLAVTTIAERLSDPETQAKIRQFANGGGPPWQA